MDSTKPVFRILLGVFSALTIVSVLIVLGSGLGLPAPGYVAMVESMSALAVPVFAAITAALLIALRRVRLLAIPTVVLALVQLLSYELMQRTMAETIGVWGLVFILLQIPVMALGIACAIAAFLSLRRSVGGSDAGEVGGLGSAGES